MHKIMELTSTLYAHLLAWIAYYKHRVILNKTQMQKLLFMCYGQALAEHHILLFNDDRPKAWPFGPVFPRVYKRYEEQIPTDLSVEEKQQFASSPDILRMISITVANYCHVSAVRLSDWSHQNGSPWQQTVFSGDKPGWNREIQQSVIIDYFSNQSWSSGI